MELAMTRLRRIIRERVGSENPLSVEELSELPWLEMQDAIDAGLADRADMAQAMFMQDLRPIHPEWSAAELRRWTEGGRWRHLHAVRPVTPLLRPLSQSRRPRHSGQPSVRHLR
jgi:hypothetical protein